MAEVIENVSVIIVAAVSFCFFFHSKIMNTDCTNHKLRTAEHRFSYRRNM